MRPFIRLPWKEVAFFGELQASGLGGVGVIVFAVSLALVEISEIVAYGPSAALEGSRDSGQTVGLAPPPQDFRRVSGYASAS